MRSIRRGLLVGVCLAVIAIINQAPVWADETPKASQAVLDETFEIAPKATKELSWDCSVPLGTLTISVQSTRNIGFAVIDEQEYQAWKARRAKNALDNTMGNALIKNAGFTTDTFSTHVPREGKYHIIINSNCFMSSAKVAIKATYE